jgi:hypothetical protein
VTGKGKKRIVVDASVARASGGVDAVHHRSKGCRDFLEAVRKICHTVVLTPEILAEWKAHRSKFARRWLVAMYARRKVYRVDDTPDEALRKKIGLSTATSKQREAMLKDIHLIEAARATDWTVASSDNTVRELFSTACDKVGEMRMIIWVNPDRADEEPLMWLADGAKAVKERRLGFRQQNE